MSAYQPPTANVFGKEVELPKFDQSSSSTVPDSIGTGSVGPNGGGRMKLKDRLALYEEDDPKTQKWICCLGFLCPPFVWMIGAVMYFSTPPSKSLTREAGYKNVLLAAGSTLLLLVLWGLHLAASSSSATGSYAAYGGYEKAGPR